jgi:hypothetical protein
MKHCHHEALQFNIIDLQSIKRRHVTHPFFESLRPFTPCLRIGEIEIGREGSRPTDDFCDLREKSGTDFVKSVLVTALDQNLL